MSNRSDKEKLEMHEHWKDYYEPLGRIFREVRKALPHCKEFVAENKQYEFDVEYVLSCDQEVRPELENLISKMIQEITEEQ